MQIIKNFIEDPVKFKQIKDLLFSANFPWFYQNTVADPKDTSGFYLTHILYNPELILINGEFNCNATRRFNEIASPILGRLKYNHIIRVRVNCYINHGKQVVNGWHTDQPGEHKVALICFNTCNGYTEFKNGEKFLSKENELCIFDGKNNEHRSVTQTDTNLRINININYI